MASRISQAIARAGWMLASLAAAIPLLSLSHHPTSVITKGGIALLAVLAGLRPHDALLAYAGLAPVATIVLLIAGPDGSPVRLLEGMTLAILAGWAARRAIRPEPLPGTPWLRAGVAMLTSAAIASAAVSAARLVAEDPATPVLRTLHWVLVRDYLVSINPVTSALQFAEGLGLVLFAAAACAGQPSRRDRVLRMMTVSAAACAVFNVLRIVFLALAREDPWQRFVEYLATARVNVHFPDWNAAGSYFAMMLLVALGLRRRALAVPCAILIAAALWLTGSRTAIFAALLAGAGAVMVAARFRERARSTVIAGVVILLVATPLAFWKWYPHSRNEGTAAALSYRILTAKAALNLTASSPVFGVGPGRLHPLAEPYVGAPQNAHNNYLQVMAELGIPGLIAFLLVLVTAMRAGAPRSLLAGLWAFLLTCFGGHPLLIPGAAFPFWTALGLAAAPAKPAASSTVAGRVALVVALIYAVSLPPRVASAMRDADLEHASVGFSAWQREPDGSRYRWAGGRSAFFVPATARAVRIPLRHGTEGPDVIEVRIRLNGRDANTIAVEAGADWRTVRLVLTDGTRGAYSRVDLEAAAQGSPDPFAAEATHTGGALMVGRPIIEP